MITQEHWANTRQTWWSCFYLLRHLCCSKLSLLRELSQSIMCSLFLTVILCVWIYIACPQFKMTLVNKCWEIFLRCIPRYGIKWIWKSFQFKVSFQWFLFEHCWVYPLCCGCVGSIHYDISPCPIKEWFVQFAPLPVWTPLVVCCYIVFNPQYIFHIFLFLTLRSLMHATNQKASQDCHSVSTDSSFVCSFQG